jgi:hypothetical protein
MCQESGNGKINKFARAVSDPQFCGPEPYLAIPVTVAESKINDNKHKMQATIQENCNILPGTFKKSTAGGSILDY